MYYVYLHQLSLDRAGYFNSFGRKRRLQEFPGCPVVRMRRFAHFHCQGPGLIPGRGTKILQASMAKKKIATGVGLTLFKHYQCYVTRNCLQNIVLRVKKKNAQKSVTAHCQYIFFPLSSEHALFVLSSSESCINVPNYTPVSAPSLYAQLSVQLMFMHLWLLLHYVL